MFRFFGYTRLAPTSADPAPGALVEVFNAGTLTPATIYADQMGTPKPPDFTADAVSGFFFFYGVGPFDVRFSGGGIATPFTWGDWSSGGGYLASSTFAALPASTPGNAGALVRVTDTTRGVWMDTGSGWYAITDEVANVMNFGAKGDGLTNDTAAINAAIATGSAVYFPPNHTYVTSGNHTLLNQRAFGVNRDTTIIQRLGDGVNPLFTVSDNAYLSMVTLDGANYEGLLARVTRTGATTCPGIMTDVLATNAGTQTPMTFAITNVTAPDATTIRFECAGHPFSVGAYVKVRDVTGFVSSGNATASVTSGVFRVTAVTASTFDITILFANLWTAYGGGGTAERASYGLHVESYTGGGLSAFHSTFERLEFRANYGHVYLNVCDDVVFNRCWCYGSTPGDAFFLNSGGCERTLITDSYFESGINTAYWGIRDLTIRDCKAYLGANVPHMIRSIGMNPTTGQAGGEVANLTVQGLKVRRLSADATNALFEVCSNQLMLQTIHVLDLVSGAGWSCIRLYGATDIALNNWTVESTNAWLLFHTGSTPAFSIRADGLYYTQGVIGTAAWSRQWIGGSFSGQVIVSNSNLNHSVQGPAGGATGFTFINIVGNLDLTNASAGGSVVINLNGTLTDPVGAVSLMVSGKSTAPRMKISPGVVYADNTAALAGGLTVGDLYRTAAGVLMTVF